MELNLSNLYSPPNWERGLNPLNKPLRTLESQVIEDFRRFSLSVNRNRWPMKAYDLHVDFMGGMSMRDWP